MEFAYDRIQEEIYSSNSAQNTDGSPRGDTSSGFNNELQETFRAFSISPWGSRLGGLWDNVRKHGESYYAGARQEYVAASEEAAKGLSELRGSIVGHARGLSLSTELGTKDRDGEKDREKDEATTPTGNGTETAAGALAEKRAAAVSPGGESFISRFKAEAARRLKEIEKVEEAADEAILRFGMNIRDKLREAVSVVPPSELGNYTSKVLFESKDAEGRRVFHATRFEAQLHVVHSSWENFTKDPVSDQWPDFKKNFDVESKTNEIAADLDTYSELRSAMEKLVPEKVEYADFWCRYYFLRLAIETEEKRRKALLTEARAGGEEDEVAWDDDSEPESNSSTPHVHSAKADSSTTTFNQSNTSALAPETGREQDTLKPDVLRRSHDSQSQADSESSYDLISGTPSHAPGSPKEKPAPTGSRAEESDEDWE